MQHMRTRFTLPGKSVYASLQDVCVALYLHMYNKKIINIQCVQEKCISSLFAKNLNDFNIHLFGRTVYYSASSSLNVKFDPSASLLLHFWDFIVAPKKLKLGFNNSTAKWILWFKTIPGKKLQTNKWTTNSWELWCLCKRFSNFYIK